MKILATLRNYVEPVEVTSIDFKTKTFTWNYRGHLENVEDVEDAKFHIVEDKHE